MLFNSIEFAIFLPLVFGLYWVIGARRVKAQNTLLFVASYIFYGWWDWRFLSLIFISSLIDFLLAQKIKTTDKPERRKSLLAISVVMNLGMLGFFKYFNFFIDSFTDAFTFFGYQFSADRLDVILPVGISFYTFQTLSYTIDVYRRKLEPTTDAIAFFTFVSFFPQLVAGPIERASNLLPQFMRERKFEYSKAVDGMRQILWGLFKKIVIADNLGRHADYIFSDHTQYPGLVLFLGALFFAFQIYCDFSGYSDIAIGTARLFGFDLMRNFAFPYFSRDIAEFWRRWHISLSTWFRDYLYIPLGGSKGSKYLQVRNTFIIFLVSGFWHGANWTFIAWGLLHAALFLPLLLLGKNRKHTNGIAEDRMVVGAREALRIISTFLLVTLGWVFFRADNIGHAFSYLSHLFSKLFHPVGLANFQFANLYIVCDLIMLILFVVIEWLQRHKQHGLEMTGVKTSRVGRWAIYLAIMFMIGMFGQTEELPFIYFQF